MDPVPICHSKRDVQILFDTLIYRTSSLLEILHLVFRYMEPIPILFPNTVQIFNFGYRFEFSDRGNTHGIFNQTAGSFVLETNLVDISISQIESRGPHAALNKTSAGKYSWYEETNIIFLSFLWYVTHRRLQIQYDKRVNNDTKNYFECHCFAFPINVIRLYILQYSIII